MLERLLELISLHDILIRAKGSSLVLSYVKLLNRIEESIVFSYSAKSSVFLYFGSIRSSNLADPHPLIRGCGSATLLDRIDIEHGLDPFVV